MVTGIDEFERVIDNEIKTHLILRKTVFIFTKENNEWKIIHLIKIQRKVEL